MGAPLRSSSVAAPLQLTLYSSSSTAATQRQPADLGLRRGASATLNHCYPVSWPILQLGRSYSQRHCHYHAAPVTVQRSVCDVKQLQPLQLACSLAGVQLSLPRDPCRHHAAPTAIMQPLPPSCSPCRPHVAPAALMRPLLPLLLPLQPPCSHCRRQRPLPP
jgi:hypothetical protein